MEVCCLIIKPTLFTLKETIVLCSSLGKQCAGYYWKPIAAVCRKCLHSGEKLCSTVTCFLCKVLWCNTSHRRLCASVCSSQWRLGFLPLCPDAVPHACSLSGFVSIPSPSFFALPGFELKPKAEQRRKSSSPTFHSRFPVMSCRSHPGRLCSRASV